MRYRSVLVAAAAFTFGACIDAVATEAHPVLEKISIGDGQSATAGNRLAHPLAVRVIYEDGSPAGSIKVNWEVVDGAGAQLSSAVTVSDAQGQASVFVTLGPTPDTVIVHASLENFTDQLVSFTSFAVEPPVLLGIEGDPFRGGDTLVIFGASLSDSATIYFGTVPSQIINIAASSDTIWVVAPSCLETGPVEVRARVGTFVSSPIFAQHHDSVTTGAIGVGTYVSVDAATAERCLLLGGTDSSAYLAAVQALTLDGVANDSFRITRGDSVLSSSPSAATDLVLEEWVPSLFDAHLRANELSVAGRMVRGGYRTEVPFAAPPSPPEVGSIRTFRVCNRLDCDAEPHFSVVEAEAKFVGEQIVLYQDRGAPSGGFTDQELATLGRLFDEEIFLTASQTFGAVSDLDRNGRVVVLMTPVVNGLTSPLGCLYGYVPGFFLPLDLDPTAVGDPRSNQAEVLYLVVPDPDGAYGCPHTNRQVEETVPVTFVHELQHAISFFQHVIVRNGMPEVVWLNEGLSHLAEDVTAIHFRALGDETRALQFETKNLANASNYLREPGHHSPIFTTGSGTGRERGAAWMLIRWVLDVYGVELTRRLVETRLTGVENLAAVTGLPAEELLTEWFLANAVTGIEGFATPHVSGYSSRDYRGVFLNLHRQIPLQFPREYPAEPTTLPAGAALHGEIRSGSGEYYLVRNIESHGAARLRIGSFTGAIDPNLAIRIHILRLR